METKLSDFCHISGTHTQAVARCAKPLRVGEPYILSRQLVHGELLMLCRRLRIIVFVLVYSQREEQGLVCKVHGLHACCLVKDTGKNVQADCSVIKLLGDALPPRKSREAAVQSSLLHTFVHTADHSLIDGYSHQQRHNTFRCGHNVCAVCPLIAVPFCEIDLVPVL